jgi:hypothetical protein
MLSVSFFTVVGLDFLGVEPFMRELWLANSWNVQERLYSVKRSLEQIYDIILVSTLSQVPLDRLYPTEDFLENDKIGLVLKKTVTENYDVPIITVRDCEDYFVLDGHHRAYIQKKLMHAKIKAYVLEFPKGTRYRTVEKRPLDSMPIKDVTVLDNMILRAWQRILSVLKHYEAIYCTPFYMRKEQIRLRDLVPTQSQVVRAQVDAIKTLLVPIVCVRHHGRYYILDGHARSLRAVQLGLDLIDSMVLFPETPIDYGVAKTANEMSLKCLKDIKTVD